MQYVDRRTMLCAIALGVLFAIRRAPAAGAVRWKIPLGRVPAPSGVLTRLPGDGNQLGGRSPLMTAPACRWWVRSRSSAPTRAPG